MRWGIAILCLLLCATLTWAGTWRDDFEDGDLEGWTTWNARGDTSAWYVRDGKLFVERQAIWASFAILDASLGWQDYTFEVDVMIQQTLNPSLVFVLMGARVSENAVNQNHVGPALAYRWNGAPKIMYGKAVKGAQELALTFFGEQPYPTQLNRWYRLKFSVVGNQYRFYIDDTLQREFTLAGYESGGVLLGAGGCIAAFDNVVITGPDIPDGGPGAQAVHPGYKLATMWGRVKGD